MSEFASHYEKAKSLIEAKDLSGALTILEQLVARKDLSLSEEEHKVKEKAIQSLAEIYSQQKRANDLSALLRNLKPYFDEIPKTKTYKIVRTLIDLLSDMEGTEQQIIALCKEYIEWTDAEKRTFLRQRLESRLAAAYFRAKEYQSALTLLTKLTREVKRLDDKPLLVEIFLLESRIHHALSHLPKSRAALTAARTNANAIYCPPLLQAELDTQSGTLHCDEKDYKTAYSYFYESFENLNTLGDARAVQCLKWMLLCKIMTNIAEDVQALINGKLALRFAGTELEAMRAVASAHSNSSLKQFKAAIETYKHELQDDPLIHRHLNALYDTLLEQNLLRIIEPFSQVQITHTAELIELPPQLVERKLSQMILDKKLKGILDQGNNCLIVFDDPEVDQTYHLGMSTITSMGRVVDRLYAQAAKLS